MTVADVVRFLEEVAPLTLAEEWDNVGLLLGDDSADVMQVMTCLTLTPDVAREAIQAGVGLVVTHHPILFVATKKLTTATPEGAMLLELARAGVAVYSAHTAYDSAWDGINQQLIARLSIAQPRPMKVLTGDEEPRAAGVGRVGDLPQPSTLGKIIEQLQAEFPGAAIGYVGDRMMSVSTVGVGCGAASQFLDLADVDVYVTGEARFHDCLKARTLGIGVVLLGHYTSERFAMERLAERLATQGVACWASRVEQDPLKWAV